MKPRKPRPGGPTSGRADVRAGRRPGGPTTRRARWPPRRADPATRRPAPDAFHAARGCRGHPDGMAGRRPAWHGARLEGRRYHGRRERAARPPYRTPPSTRRGRMFGTAASDAPPRHDAPKDANGVGTAHAGHLPARGGAKPRRCAQLGLFGRNPPRPCFYDSECAAVPCVL